MAYVRVVGTTGIINRSEEMNRLRLALMEMEPSRTSGGVDMGDKEKGRKNDSGIFISVSEYLTNALFGTY